MYVDIKLHFVKKNAQKKILKGCAYVRACVWGKNQKNLEQVRVWGKNQKNLEQVRVWGKNQKNLEQVCLCVCVCVWDYFKKNDFYLYFSRIHGGIRTSR